MKKLLGLIVAGALLGAWTGSVIGQARIGMAPLNCDRACLNGVVDSYFAAMVAHDPKRVALAAGGSRCH